MWGETTPNSSFQIYNSEFVRFAHVPGGLAGGATPVPIPNTEVKPSKADDTAAVRQWESRTLPGYKRPVRLQNLTGIFFYNPAASGRQSKGFIRRRRSRHGDK